MSDSHTPWKVEKVPTSVGFVWKIGPFNVCLYADTRGGVCNEGLSVEEAEDIANRIVTCVNTHDELLGALEWYAGEGTGEPGQYQIVHVTSGTVVHDFSTFGDRARKAIAKAKENNS